MKMPFKYSRNLNNNMRILPFLVLRVEEANPLQINGSDQIALTLNE